MRLPITNVPGSRPLRFRWTTTIDMMGGVRSLLQEGSLPSGVDVAVMQLITLCADLDALNGKLNEEVAELRKLNEGLAERISAQSDLLSKKSEKPVPTIQPTGTVPITPLRKGRT